MNSSTPKRRWLQFSLRTLLVAITLTAIGLGVVWRLWPWWQERVLVSQLREQVLAAKTSAEAREAYRALLPPDKRERMSRLTNDPDTGIALKAMHELLADRTRADTKLLPDQQHTFLRLFHERTGLTPPAWWSAGLLGRFYNGDPSVFGYAQKIDSEESVILTLSNRQLKMPADQFATVFPPRSFRESLIALRIGSPRSYLARVPRLGFSFDLYALDSKTGNSVWNSKVWADGYAYACVNGDEDIVMSTHRTQDAQIELNDRCVAVWGHGIAGTYVEVFDACSGENLFRFCTE